MQNAFYAQRCDRRDPASQFVGRVLINLRTKEETEREREREREDVHLHLHRGHLVAVASASYAIKK